MNQDKPWYTSKTLWGLIISMILKTVGIATGYEVAQGDVDQLTDIVVPMASFAVSFGGDIFAWYGRIKATKEISSKPLG